MTGEVYEGLVIVAAVAAIVYILWRNNEGVRQARRGPAENSSGRNGAGGSGRADD
ncbi:hypothetical protein [Devosia lacusdianchii]|uniref:hypothetical protein n=1 Tax=Devosia lacusdianchii TaxID=2917991 RepID=UPI001F06EFEB|nr:hypothetical protein [Devosia sp. JXJ CY 41]